MKFSTLLDYYKCNPHDVHTVPTTGARPLWFHVYFEDGALRVKSPKEKTPGCVIKGSRLIEGYKFEDMLNLYEKRKKGVSVAKDAAQMTQNASYWFGILNDVEKNCDGK